MGDCLYGVYFYKDEFSKYLSLDKLHTANSHAGFIRRSNRPILPSVSYITTVSLFYFSLEKTLLIAFGQNFIRL